MHKRIYWRLILLPSPQEPVLSCVRVPAGSQFLLQPIFAVITMVQVDFNLAIVITAECGQAVYATGLILIPGVEKRMPRWSAIDIPKAVQRLTIVTAPSFHELPGDIICNAASHRAIRQDCTIERLEVVGHTDKQVTWPSTPMRPLTHRCQVPRQPSVHRSQHGRTLTEANQQDQGDT